MVIGGALTGADVEILERSTVYRGFFAVDQLRLRHRLFAGGWSAPVRRELFVRGESVGVLLYDPSARLVGLVEQFRVGALAESRGPWQLEVVAGIREAGESPLEVARREVLEEAGIGTVELLPICDYYASPGGSDERIRLFCGLADLVGRGGVFGLQHDHEDILLHVLPESAAMTALGQGRCDNAATVICLQWLQLNRRRLQGDRAPAATTDNGR